MKKTFTMVALLASMFSQAQSLTDSLVAYYPFTGNAKDHSGNGHDLVVNNAILTADRNGQPDAAYLLNGTNAYLGLTSAGDFFLDEYSYSFWFRINNLPPQGTTQAMMSIGGDIKDNGFNLSNKYVGIYSGIGSWTYHKNAQKTSSVSDPNFNDANWHHVVATRDMDSIMLFIDGIKVGSDYTGDGAGYTGGGLGFYVGCRSGNSLYFAGVVDDVRVWKRTLKEAEVVQLYNSTKTSAPSINDEANFSVYPNPSQGNFTLETDGLNSYHYRVINAVGVEMTRGIVQDSPVEFQLGHSGFYFLSLYNEEGTLMETRRIIVK